MRIAVVGLGLIGGSLARGLTAKGYRLVGVDVPAVRRRALRAGAVAATFSRVEDAVRSCDVVVLAAPPEANLRLLRRVARVAGPGLLVTDVGSVKQPICDEAARLGLRGFVGGHPMAGSEDAGFAASSADLFRGRPWVLTPGPGPALRTVRRLVLSLGARPALVPPDEHDRAMAFLSHVPQLVAWALHAAASGDRVAGRRLRLAGPGYRDMTRLAGSPRALWREILRQNHGAVARALAAFRRRLAEGARP